MEITEKADKLRVGITMMANNELTKKELTLDQLMCIFHIIAYGAPVSYRKYDPMIPKEERDRIMGYVGAGWFVEDHF